MKVSILTYHWEDNYGAVMQAYATARAVKELGHDPEFIDLRLPYKPSLAQRLVFSLKRLKFNSFRKKYYLKLTPKKYWSIEELRKDPPESDCYLVGSDQTWNPNIAGELLPAFFLDFGPDSIRRVSFATSIGQNSWHETNLMPDSSIRRAISAFKTVLLREDSAVEICRTVFGREARQVIDPVLLFASYPELTGEVKPSGELIAYKLIDDPAFYEMARKLAGEMGLPIRSIGSVRRPPGFRMSYPESPVEWVRRFAGASFVLTDSFHGTVFSIIYHRPFIIYVGDPSRTTRLESLLGQLGLSNRLLTSHNTYEDFLKVAETNIDWDKVDYRLSELRKESFNLLKEELS